MLGDQLNRSTGALGAAHPDTTRILMVESADRIASKPFHRQRIHLVVTAMGRFAAELEDEAFDVDYRREPSLATGHEGHVRGHRPTTVRAAEPASRGANALLSSLGVEMVRDGRFLCHHSDFAAWADGRTRLRMEDSYR